MATNERAAALRFTCLVNPTVETFATVSVTGMLARQNGGTILGANLQKLDFLLFGNGPS